MPWLETDPVTERKRFIVEAQGGVFSLAELCRRHNISRQKGYKWLERYEAEGPEGLLDCSHRPHACPHATEEYVLEAAFELRRARPRWGAGKILGHLAELHPKWPLPARQVLHKAPRARGTGREEAAQSNAAASRPSHRALRCAELRLVG